MVSLNLSKTNNPQKKINVLKIIIIIKWNVGTTSLKFKKKIINI